MWTRAVSEGTSEEASERRGRACSTCTSQGGVHLYRRQKMPSVEGLGWGLEGQAGPGRQETERHSGSRAPGEESWQDQRARVEVAGWE